MPTIAEQLTQLTQDRDDLVDNLTTKGITGLTGDETFTELVPEVLNIPSGGEDLSEYFGNLNYATPASQTSLLNYAIKKIPSWITIKNDATRAFYRCANLTTIPLIDTSNITNAEEMFMECYALTTIPLIDTSNVTNMNEMFAGCRALTTIPLIDTSKATRMYYMFGGCSVLTEIPLIDISKVTTVNSMFTQCYALTTVPALNTSSVTNFANMFSNCSRLSNDSLNNILKMCIDATSYTGVKTLAKLGLTSSQATTCQGLSNYQDFIAAGWTTGY